MSQLALVWSAPFDPDRAPDNRHDWGRPHAMLPTNPECPKEWRCDTCGELATLSTFAEKWLFLRPQLATKPRGEWHYAEDSHPCEPREWQ